MCMAKRGEIRVEQPLVIHQASGRKLLDFIWISLEPLVHERVMDLLTLSSVTGWATYPVEVYDSEERSIPGYHGFSITGRCESMFMDRDHSQLVYEENPRGRFPYYKGLFITTDSWDGSDIFTAADGRTGHIIITERVRDLFRKAKATNVRFEPVSEVRVYATDQTALLRTGHA